jgi:hypothetical protein
MIRSEFEKTGRGDFHADFACFVFVLTISINHLLVRFCSIMFFGMKDEIENELPDPELVAQAAALAPAPRVLEDYIDAMRILRDKKFTFREIAEWLEEEFDIKADHNSVWRAYTKAMDDFDAHLEAEADEETEQEDALVEAERKGTLKIFYPEPVPTDAVTAQAQSAVEVPKAASGKAKKGKKKVKLA